MKVKSFRDIAETNLASLSECRVCPRNCGTDRLSGKTGVCGSDARFNISSICVHKGEEPVISGDSGICNVFFSRCNLSCSYCQNWQISAAKGEVLQTVFSLDQVVASITALLDKGCKAVGFVSPSHYIPHVKAIIEALRSIGRSAIFIYNTNGYDLADEIRGLENYIDVYLPDFKYADPELSYAYSRAKDYPRLALAAIKEMYRQKGSTLLLDDKGHIEKGLIIRHLIMPGAVDNSFQVLKLIAGELSESVAISLMSQYWPTPKVECHPTLGRSLNRDEYEQVVEEMENLGFYKGWVQELESHSNYRPDFERDHPFESI
ncbi:MAG: radical SAM protein [Bacteroidetes bacterium]|nr:radical SAM protein [Bacteroidota bacterium]